jgi:CBS domain-containing protein
MTPRPVTTRPDTAVGEVWRIMNERRFRHMLVAEDSERLVGIVTQRDLLVAARASGQKIDFDDDRPVSEVMNRTMDTVRPECCAAEAARHMLRTKRSCLPVVDEEGALVGVLTEADYLRLATRGVPPCTCGGVAASNS